MPGFHTAAGERSGAHAFRPPLVLWCVRCSGRVPCSCERPTTPANPCCDVCGHVYGHIIHPESQEDDG